MYVALATVGDKLIVQLEFILAWACYVYEILLRPYVFKKELLNGEY